MELYRVKIKNYRSIRYLELKFNPSCRVLVGLNESGKTNILKALSLLSTDYEFSSEDIRDPLPDEEIVTESYVWFIFKFSPLEVDEIVKNVQDKLLTYERSAMIFLEEGVELDVRKAVENNGEGLYVVNILNDKRSYSYWSFSKNLRINSSWKKPSANCPSDFSIKNNKGETTLINEYRAINASEFKEIPETYLEEIDVEEITELMGSGIADAVEHNMPECMLWSYSEQNLLPGKIDLAQFTRNPSTCLPLKYMFNLAGVGDITETLTREAERKNGIPNLLNRVAETTTKQIHNIWKEYKSVRLSLSQNGPHIDAGIKDKNIFDLDRRSDGFKRFLTFILMISAKERTEQLVDTLILIDEPDIGLHPSGARYLRDELLKISKSNTVVYSTHSIFMIDKNNVSRHLIVKKDVEVSTAEQVSSSNIKDEEVIFNALGYSVFETLEENNIVFEGWKDKALFNVALKSTKHNDLKKYFKNIGKCHAEGVKDVPRVSTVLELANRECYIVSDNDSVAIQRQKNYKGYGTWYRYSQLVDDDSIITGEDFIKETAFKAPLEKLKKNVKELNGKTIPTFSEPGKLAKLKEWLRSNGIVDNGEQKELMDQVKEELFDNLKTNQIESSYFDFLTNLKNKISGN